MGIGFGTDSETKEKNLKGNRKIIKEMLIDKAILAVITILFTISIMLPFIEGQISVTFTDNIGKAIETAVKNLIIYVLVVLLINKGKKKIEEKHNLGGYMKEVKIGEHNETTVSIDKYGAVKIGKYELTADDISIIHTISQNERATYMAYKE